MKRLSLIAFALAALASAAFATQITISSVAINDWRLPTGSPFEMRAYALQTFVTSDGATVLQGSGTQFYRSASCSLVSTTLTCNSLVLDSTTNSASPSVTWAADIYNRSGQFVYRFLYGFKVTDGLGTTVSWDQIRLYNSSVGGPLPPSYYTANQVDALIGAGHLQPTLNCGTNIKTINSNCLLASGDLAVQTPLVSGTNIKTVDGQSMLGAGDVPLAQKELSAYSNFTNAVSSIGSTAAVLDIDANSTCSTSITIPATLKLVSRRNKTITRQAGCNITLLDTGIDPTTTSAVFSGFSPGEIKWTGAMPTLRPEWFGAKGDCVLDANRNYISGTDDLLAFETMIAATGKVVGSYVVNTEHIVLTAGKVYYLSDTLNIDTQVVMEGEGGPTVTSFPALKFAANKTGIVQHSLTTNTGGVLITPYRVADFSTFKNFALLGTAGGNNTNVSVGMETINGTSTITLNENSGGLSFAPGTGFHNGNTITIGTWTYIFDNTDPLSTGSTTKVTLKKPRLFYYSFATEGAPSPYIYRGSYASWAGAPWLNQLIRLENNQVYKVIELVPAPAEFPLSDRIKLGDPNTGVPVNFGPHGGTGAQHAGTAYIESLSLTNQDARANIYHGIDLRGQTDVENMTIREFAGNGIEANSQATPSYNLGTVPNMNNSVIRRNTLYQNWGSGLRMFGTNSNQILIEINDASYNYGAGIMEQSLLGNTYVGNHTSYNVYAPEYADTAANSSVFLNQYEEGDGTSSRFGQNNMLLGGNVTSGGGIDTIFGSKNWMHPDQGVIVTDNFATRSVANYKTMGMLFGSTVQDQVFGFGAAEEPLNTGGGGTVDNLRVAAYRMMYYSTGGSDPFTGWYRLQYGTNISLAPLLLSGGNASYGAGKVWLVNGFRIGYPGFGDHFVDYDTNGIRVDTKPVVTTTDTQTLTSKTLTSPTITGATITGGTILTNNAGLQQTDLGGSNKLTFKVNETLTAPRTFNFLTGDVDRTLTMAGNATISGTNTGDQTITLTGDVTGSGTGSFAATIGASRVTNSMLAGSIDLTSKVTGILPAANGGNGNGFFAVSGPATSTKTFTLPNASATILTDNALVTGAQGGTGVNNSGKTITLGGNLTTSGAFATTLTETATTSVTLPTAGTLATLAGSESLTNKKLGSLTTNGPIFTSAGDGTLNSEAQLSSTRGGTGVNNAGTLTYGSNNVTLTTSGTTSVTLPTAGTLATTSALFGGPNCTVFNVTGSDATTTGAVLADITGLVTGTLALNSNYIFNAILYVTTTAVTTGTEYGTNVTVAPTRIAANYVGPTTVASNIQTMQTTGTNANNIATPAFLTTASEEGVINISGFFTTAGSGTPVFSLRHLKFTSGTSTVKIGSWMVVCKQ